MRSKQTQDVKTRVLYNNYMNFERSKIETKAKEGT